MRCRRAYTPLGLGRDSVGLGVSASKTWANATIHIDNGRITGRSDRTGVDLKLGWGSKCDEGTELWTLGIGVGEEKVRFEGEHVLSTDRWKKDIINRNAFSLRVTSGWTLSIFKAEIEYELTHGSMKPEDEIKTNVGNVDVATILPSQTHGLNARLGLGFDFLNTFEVGASVFASGRLHALKVDSVYDKNKKGNDVAATFEHSLGVEVTLGFRI